MNSFFEGVKLPTAANIIASDAHAQEVCLTSLLKGINEF